MRECLSDGSRDGRACLYQGKRLGVEWIQLFNGVDVELGLYWSSHLDLSAIRDVSVAQQLVHKSVPRHHDPGWSN